MGKKKAVKLGINLGQYSNEGGGHLSQPNQIKESHMMPNFILTAPL